MVQMNAQLDEDWKPPPEAVMLRNCMTAAYSSGVATAVCVRSIYRVYCVAYVRIHSLVLSSG